MIRAASTRERLTGRSPLDCFEDHGQGDFRVHRDIYRDPDIFDLEMTHLFEGGWNLVGLAAEIPQPHDYVTTWLGRTPLILSRDGNGKLHALINSCRHKGAMVAHRQRGNSRTFVCRYHGWTYDTAGRCILVRDEAQGAYPAGFAQLSHDLQPVARFGEYRGILFASLVPDVPPLETWLGELRVMLDLIADQSPHGIECIPGQGRFLYRGNWKLQLENGVDPYHFSATHVSYIQALQQRAAKASVYSRFRSNELQRGTFAFEHGHNTLWGPAPPGKTTPLSWLNDELLQRVGPVRTRWMHYVRNTTVFPNAQFAENASLQLRVWRPLAPDLTEVRTWCLAPVGEPAEARRLRIRQYEEFFNPSGLATPDDLANYEDSQRGLSARQIAWQQGHSRGAGLMEHPEARAAAQELGVNPLAAMVGSFDSGDETIMQPTYRYWRQRLGQPSAEGDQ